MTEGHPQGGRVCSASPASALSFQDAATFGLVCLGMTDAVLTTILRHRKHKQGQSPLRSLSGKTTAVFQ